MIKTAYSRKGERSGRHPLRVVALVLVQIILALGIVELLWQMYFDNPYSFQTHRYVFTSADSFRNLDRFWTYSPNRTIREIAIYQTALGGFRKEYECDYRTDDFGFIDNPDRDRRDYDYLLLGDSYTQGEGGCPWIDRLRKFLPKLSIYNAGLEGTGVGTWAATARYLTDQGFHFKTAIAIFVADDFSRHLAIYRKNQLDCLHDISLCHGEFLYPMVPDEDLTRITAGRAQLTTSVSEHALYFCKEYLWVTCFLAQGLRNWLQPPSREPLISEDAKRGFEWLSANFPRLRFIRVDTKDEAALRSSNAATLAVERYLDAKQVGWATCNIDYNGFLARDPHPNQQGYTQLARCVARVIDQSQPHAGFGQTLKTATRN